MRATFVCAILVLVTLPATPTATAAACLDSPTLLACAGRVVLSDDCTVGAMTLQGAYLRDRATGNGVLVGELTMRWCDPHGSTADSHSIQAWVDPMGTSIGWYESRQTGWPDSCGLSVGIDVDTGCGTTPPYLPALP